MNGSAPLLLSPLLPYELGSLMLNIPSKISGLESLFHIFFNTEHYSFYSGKIPGGSCLFVQTGDGLIRRADYFSSVKEVDTKSQLIKQRMQASHDFTDYRHRMQDPQLSRLSAAVEVDFCYLNTPCGQLIRLLRFSSNPTNSETVPILLTVSMPAELEPVDTMLDNFLLL